MEKLLKEKLKKNGQSQKWFYDKYIKDVVDISYSGFCHQLNQYNPLSEQVKFQIERYFLGE